jgi:hypothetical protein
MGFPNGDTYVGAAEQDDRLERQFVRKIGFMNQHKIPIWNGEFGPVYANPSLESDAAATNERRYALLGKQLAIYDKYRIHWSIWLFKDIGLQGMVHVNPESKWMKTIAPFQERKRALQLDAWGRSPSEQVDEVINPLVEWIDRVAPQSKEMYPTPWATHRQIIRLINQIWLAGCLQDEFAELFRDMSFEDLEECAMSFHFDKCLQRDGLNKALEEHASLSGTGERLQPNGIENLDGDDLLKND